MPQIQWYPGHMHKAKKEIINILPKVDIIIEMLDARIPYSSNNPLIGSLRGDKPLIKILNKCDLADPINTKAWQTFFEQEHNVKTLAFSQQQKEKNQSIRELCYSLAAKVKAQNRAIHALIMGIPNVGKSTLINSLSGKHIANTGNEPAITKHQQRIKLSNDLILLDTPGLLWPNVENKHSGYRLAITGAIKDTVFAYDEISLYAAEYLLKTYDESLKQRYQLTEIPKDEYLLLEIIAKQRGAIARGSSIDWDKAGKSFIQDIRNGKLGALTLETPAMIKTELQELAILREIKQEKKMQRTKKRKK